MTRNHLPYTGMLLAAVATVAGVTASLVGSGTTGWPWYIVGAGLFCTLLPFGRPIQDLPPPVNFGVLVFQAGLVLTAGLVSGHDDGVFFLYFILIPLAGRLPRPYAISGYVLFPVLAIGPDGLQGGTGVYTSLPGFLAMVAFSEAIWGLRRTIREKEKLIDELVEAQAQLRAAPAQQTSPQALEALGLTRRDREVLVLVALGFSNKEIADRLFLAEGTVKNRVSALLEKTGVRDRTQAALRARELGIL